MSGSLLIDRYSRYPFSFSSCEYLGYCSCMSEDSSLERIRDGIRDQLTVKPSIFNENLVGMHTRNDYPGKVYSRPIAFQGLRIGARPLAFRIQHYAGCIKKR